MWKNWVIGLLISMVLSRFVIWFVLGSLRRKLELKSGNFSGILGVLEGLMYTTSWVYGAPEFIGIWLAIKMVGRWSIKGVLEVYTTVENNPAETVKKTTGQINTYFIGNLLSVFFGVLGGQLIKVLNAGHPWMAIFDTVLFATK